MSVLRDRAEEGSGDEGGMETPENIPNSEVKHPSGDDSWLCACENSTLPGLFFCVK